MKKLAWFLVFFTPLLVGGTADAFFDISAPIQRAVMIANQVTQISHAVTSLAALQQQFDKIKEQYDHLREQTFGQVGQLTDSFSDLSSVPGQLVGDGLSWRQDFANTKADALVTALGVCAAGKITSSTSHQMAQNASESDGGSHRLAFLWHRSRTLSHHKVP